MYSINPKSRFATPNEKEILETLIRCYNRPFTSVNGSTEENFLKLREQIKQILDKDGKIIYTLPTGVGT